MGLKLTITSEQQRLLGMRASIVFGVGGGSIGRAPDNDWVLPDPKHYLSAHHARVQFKHGAYYLLDTSSNGVYVNDDTAPIGRRSTFPLRGGERLRLGDYDLAVSLGPDPAPEDAAEAASITPVNAELALEDLISTRGDIGADLNVRDLLVPDPSPSTSARVGPVDAFGQPVWALGSPASDHSAAPAAPAHSPGPPAAALREPRSAERASAEGAAGIEAFCRGAGIELTHLPADAQARLHLAGVLLREALVGVKGLALTQREIRDQTQIDLGKQEPQPIALTGLTVEDLLKRLLLGHEKHELDAVQWLRDTLGGSRRHDLATMRALHTALGEYVARLNPSTLAQSAADRRAPGGRAAPGARPYYESGGDPAELAARFHSITEMSDGKLPHLFMEAFARAYAAEFQRPNGAGAKP